MSGWTTNDIPDQSGRVVVVTGANSGLGYASAVALARKGAQVVMACRSPDRADQAHKDLLGRAPGAKADLMALDLGSLKSVHGFAVDFSAKYARLDVLMNNAGIMVPPYGKTADGFEIQFGTNHLGHFALTGLLLPKLLETPASRVVTVSSGAYLNGRINFDDLQSERQYQPWGAYSQSKLANILFMLELQRRLDAASADVISVATHPGYTVTNLQQHSGGLLNNGLFSILRPLMSQLPDSGASYQVYAATAPDVRGGEFFGPRYGMKGGVIRLSINAQGKNAALAARLWEVSEKLTSVRFELPESSAKKQKQTA